MRSFLIIIFFILTLYGEDDYQLGEGVQVGSLPLYVGGYFSLDYKNMDELQRYRVDDLAILAYGGYDKLSYMLELEFKELYVYTDIDGNTDTSTDTNIYVERVYLDYSFNENYIFRLGKYNSPIGFWNLLPVNVLRETTSNPMSSYIIFPKFTTGGAMSYSSYDSGEFKIDVMLQHNDDISADYNNYQVDKHYGFGLTYALDNLTLKLNGGYFQKDDSTSDALYYALVSAKYENDDYQIMSEIGTQKSKEDYTTTYAGYIQGLYRFTPQHIGIMRAESYENKLIDTSDDMAIIGYTYRPLYPIAIKSEYQFHSQDKLNQFLFSISVLF